MEGGGDGRLYDALVKRYPFRQVPLVPPKRLAVNGHYLSTESDFLERRRRGLVRFMNSIVRHPVFRDDDLVIAFITVPTVCPNRDWTNLGIVDMEKISFNSPCRRIHRQGTSPGPRIPYPRRTRLPTRPNPLNPHPRHKHLHVPPHTSRPPAYNSRQCHILDSLRYRIRVSSVDFARYANFLTQLSEDTDLCPLRTCVQCPAIDSGMRNVALGLDLVSGILGDEARSWDEGILEDLKRQRDVLVGMKEMFDRRDRLAGDNVPSLEKRISTCETKIRTLRERPDAESRVEQIAKLEEQIESVVLGQRGLMVGSSDDKAVVAATSAD
jgi:sorting nexin-8